MAVTAVVFDVGETLVDETRNWEGVADACGIPRFTLMALIGAAIGRGESHQRAIEWLGLDVPSSERWGVEKPDPRFFDGLVDEVGCPAAEIAYVGDRVDNDIEPALAAGLVAVHLRRGPWGHLHEPPIEAISISSLRELPGELA